jgi:FixJ family two-component response regulator
MTQATAIVHVVDDDESLRTALMRLLRASGYEVRTYASAGDFLLNKPESAPGCVVLDVRMPAQAVSNSRRRSRNWMNRCQSFSLLATATSR